MKKLKANYLKYLSIFGHKSQQVLLTLEGFRNKRTHELVVRSGKGSKRRVVPLNKDARGALLLLGYRTYLGSIHSLAGVSINQMKHKLSFVYEQLRKSSATPAAFRS